MWPSLFDLILVLLVATTAGPLLGVLPLDAARPAAAEGRLEREVDVLLAVEPHDEGGHVHHLEYAIGNNQNSFRCPQK